MRIGVVEVTECTEVSGAKSSNSKIVVMVEAIKSTQPVGYLPIRASSRQSLVKRYTKRSRELGKALHGSELLAILIIVLKLYVPEELVLTRYPPIRPLDLPIERRFLSGGRSLV